MNFPSAFFGQLVEIDVLKQFYESSLSARSVVHELVCSTSQQIYCTSCESVRLVQLASNDLDK